MCYIINMYIEPNEISSKKDGQTRSKKTTREAESLEIGSGALTANQA